MAFNQEARMTKRHGGSRPGAGRKAKRADAAPSVGAKTANFSTRITPETRAAIEAEARAAHPPRSVSQMAEFLIRRGLDAKRDAVRNNATRAICYLLGELAEIVAPEKLNTENFAFNWRSDPFLFEAFKLSFLRLMDAMRPAGDAISPVDREPLLTGTTFWGPLDSPAARAEYAATILLHNLHAARAQPQEMLQHAPAGVEKKTLDTPYDLHRAWKGLNGDRTK
jgi:hypothetical protein